MHIAVVSLGAARHKQARIENKSNNYSDVTEDGAHGSTNNNRVNLLLNNSPLTKLI